MIQAMNPTLQHCSRYKQTLQRQHVPLHSCHYPTWKISLYSAWSRVWLHREIFCTRNSTGSHTVLRTPYMLDASREVPRVESPTRDLEPPNHVKRPCNFGHACIDVSRYGVILVVRPLLTLLKAPLVIIDTNRTARTQREVSRLASSVGS